MTVRQIRIWLLSRAPYVDWDVYDTGDHIVISAPEPDGIRRIVAVTYAEVAALKP